MQLLFSIKSIGKKKAYIKDVSIDIDISTHTTVKEFLLKVVDHQVNAYTKRKEDSSLLVYLNEDMFKQVHTTGQVKFGDHYNTTPVDEVKAKEAVLLAFEDGLIALFINEERYENINDSISLAENDSITFIRLTFLAGRSW